MIPVELVGRPIQLPEKDSCRIVIFTGTALRHDRFALRIQRDFGERVVGWFQVARASQLPLSGPKPSEHYYRSLKELVENPRKLLRLPLEAGERILRALSRRPSQEEEEERLFGDEVRSLRKTAHLQPVRVSDPSAPAVVEAVEGLRPYLILTLGGAIYSERLLKAARGLALNQHDGWCPAYKGTHTVDWALFHRDIAHIGSTIHILTQGLDAGPIVRRSTACLVKGDTRESCFARVVALGTELMCEVVAEVIRADQLTVYDQPGGQGFTYLGAHRTEKILRAIDRDLGNGWLSSELSRLRTF